MEIKKIYELNQTHFGKRTLIYSLCKSKNKEESQYGIQLVMTSEKEKEEVMIQDISNNKNYVMNLITYLYENAIDTIHLKDVVEDYISATV